MIALALVSSGAVAAQELAFRAVATSSPARLDALDSISDAVSDGRGHFLILDKRRGRILITDTKLKVLGASPWRVGGVTRFWDPAALTSRGDGTIAMLDRARHRITELSVAKDGATLDVERTIPLALRTTEGMCALSDGNFVVYGYNEGKRLHIIDGSTGETLRSFAPADEMLHARAQEIVTQGRIACDPDNDEVVLTTRFLPDVQAYRISTGEATWAGKLSPFRSIKLVDRGDGVSLMSGPTGYSHVSTVFFAGDQRVFQTIIAARQDGVQVDTVITYAFSRRTHRWHQSRLDLPIVVPLNVHNVLFMTQQPHAVVQLARVVP